MVLKSGLILNSWKRKLKLEMKIEIEFEVNKTIEELKNLSMDYFCSQGFTLANKDENSQQFVRGSAMRNMIAFNPLKWKSSTRILFGENRVVLFCDIDTIHQAVTLNEKNLWKEFISNYQKSIETGESFISENQIALKSTKKSSWKYIRFAILGGVIFGLLCGIIAYQTGIDSIVPIGAAGGAMMFLMYKINKEKE